MKSTCKLLIGIVVLAAVSLCQAADRLDARIAKVDAALSARLSGVQNVDTSGPASKGQDTAKMLEARITDLADALASLQAELTNLKAERSQDKKAPVSKEQDTPAVTQKQIDSMVNQAIEKKKSGLGDLPAWLKKFSFNGDFRYRYEWIDDEAKTDDRNRNRIRARIGIAGKVNDEVDVKLRLASGDSSAATSTNQSLDGSFSSKDLWLDLAYFDYHPRSIKNLNVLGGKIKNPYFMPGKSDLMWDSDVNPEGVAAKYRCQLNETIEFFGAMGGYYVEERSTSADSSLWGAQGGLKCKLPGYDKVTLTAGGGYYDFANAKGRATFGAGALGNSTSGGNYTNDYDVVQAFAQLDIPIGPYPVAVFFDFIKNVAAKNSEDTGYLVGASIGKCKAPGTWKASYSYRKLEADATLGAFSDADFGGGGTAVKGHKVGLGYQLAKSWTLGTSYFINKTLDTKKNYDRLQADLKFKF